MKKHVGLCIYCKNTSNLSDEHVLPYGLGGELILGQASCEECRKNTESVETRLLRKHWLPPRRRLNLRGRRPLKQPTDIPVRILRAGAEPLPARLPADQQNLAIAFHFDTPAVLLGHVREGRPAAPVMFRKVGPDPEFVFVGAKRRDIQPGEEIEIAINVDAADVVRFLSKVAHGFAIYERGADCCTEFFLPQIIRGDVAQSMTYVGLAGGEIAEKTLPGTSLHGVAIHEQSGFLTVLVQLFRGSSERMPIYQAVVGRMRSG